VIADRLVSLSDPDARPIRKGKPGRPTEFGSSLLVAEDERGLSPTTSSSGATHPTPRGWSRPSPGSWRSPAGRPGTVVGDRGFGTVANDQAMEAVGVKRVGLQRTGTPGRARLAVERTRAFRRLRNWRVGIEARSSHLKRSFGLRRTRLRRLGGARTWVGWGIFAYNLQRRTVVAG
jgi:transposase, IS5 family